ncbi:MAG TPA: hypothetical protein VMN78_09130 [Longimicrobiales bacterium]|nr:hypothetical protein [Longimicrobiales bacterium]
MRLRNLIIGLALALLPAAADAQQGDPDARIDAALEAAARAEIPVSLLESKVQEGRAKGVAEARIASAVEARLNALVRAQGALARGGARAVGAADLSIAADALQGGVSETALLEVMTTTPPQRRAVAAAVLTELVRLGVASDVAVASVNAAIAAGGEALVNLPAQVPEAARSRGGVRVNVGPPAGVDAGVHGGIEIGGDVGGDVGGGFDIGPPRSPNN